MYRLPNHEIKYKNHLVKELGCPFCNPNPKQVLKRIGNFYLIKNIYGYDLWDRRRVVDHLLIVPKKHAKDFKSVGKGDIETYFKIMAKYSGSGYDIFTRAASSRTKSQSHFHTHLIKTSGKLAKIINFSDDPYNLSFI